MWILTKTYWTKITLIIIFISSWCGYCRKKDIRYTALAFNVLWTNFYEKGSHFKISMFRSRLSPCLVVDEKRRKESLNAFCGRHPRSRIWFKIPSKRQKAMFLKWKGGGVVGGLLTCWGDLSPIFTHRLLAACAVYCKGRASSSKGASFFQIFLRMSFKMSELGSFQRKLVFF